MGSLAPPEAARGLARLKLWIGTCFGIGRAPVAPGTFGSLAGVAIGWALLPAGRPALIAACLVCTAIGFWSAGEAARQLGARDPGAVVIDEVAGQLVAIAIVPGDLTVLALAFLLFRVFDITKPFPARRLEALPGGSGIMVDDLVAGAYAGLLLLLLLALGLLPA